jgi:hypothetical protein
MKGTARSRRVATDAEKAEALRLADEYGPAEASRRTGIAGRVKAWRSREGRVDPAGLRPAGVGERRRKSAEGA